VVLVWLVGDLLPRVLASLSPDLVEAGGAVATASLRLFRPLLRLVAWADRGGRGIHAAPDTPPAPGADREMLGGVFALRDMTVAEVMTPRIDIVAVDLADDRTEVVERFRQSEHSRLLVFDRSPDAVVGVLYAKDLLPGLGDTGEWHPLIRPAAFVPEAKSLASQLLDFQRGPSHIGVVVDEFGGTAGLITLEDALEQIVGEIRDEYDTDEALLIQAQAAGAGWCRAGWRSPNWRGTWSTASTARTWTLSAACCWPCSGMSLASGRRWIWDRIGSPWTRWPAGGCAAWWWSRRSRWSRSPPHDRPPGGRGRPDRPGRRGL
jgi:CBS domain-containing protein